ncbi:MAG: MFS transporter [Lactimicrobium sp.]|jgi:PPP family 3-phenylpropionic acid transporter|uniref:MFS transporter n=1 Tax=Lactimicrobium sp. TaxID=2563780 RepID=UPI002F34FF87
MNQKKLKTRLTLDYAGIQGFYSTMYAGVGAFLSVFLLANGFSNTEVGLVMSGANLLTVLLSPGLADFADRTKKVTLTQLISLLAFLTGLMCIFLMILHGHSAALFICYVLALVFDLLLQPLVNTLVFRIQGYGIQLNFGLCRAAGSLLYAIMTAVLGVVIEKAGINSIPGATIFSLILLLISIFLLKKHLGPQTSSSHVEPKEEERITLKDFIRNNKAFLVLNIGIMVMYYYNYIIGSFMLQVIKPLGGTVTDMGNLFALGAAMEIPAMVSFDWLRRRLSAAHALQVSMIGFSLKALLVLLAGNVTLVYVSQLLSFMAYGLFYPAIVQYTGERMKAGEAVKGQSMFTIMMMASGIIANVSGGMILDAFGPHLLVLLSFVFCVIGSVIVIFMSNKVPVKA